MLQSCCWLAPLKHFPLWIAQSRAWMLSLVQGLLDVVRCFKTLVKVHCYLIFSRIIAWNIEWEKSSTAERLSWFSCSVLTSTDLRTIQTCASSFWLIINLTFFSLLTWVSNVCKLALKGPTSLLRLFIRPQQLWNCETSPVFGLGSLLIPTCFFKWRSTSRQCSFRLRTTQSRLILPSNTPLIIKTRVVEAALPGVHQWRADS